MSEWKDKVAVVTGGGSGIGRALALALAARGVKVVVADLNPETAAATALACGQGATSVGFDVRDAAAFRRCIEDAAATHGSLDYLFNNAGIGVGGEAYELPLEAWDLAIDVNLRGVVHGVAVAYPLMVKQGSGHIINTASLAGLGPSAFLVPYSMTKHAVVGLSSSLRIEGAALGVRVSVLCPAAIDTPLLDVTRNPELPDPVWIPNIRKYLTKISGTPYPAEQCAEDTLNAVSKNEGVIVIPKRAKMIWRLGRFFPALIEKGGLRAAAAERARRAKGQK